MSAAERRRRVMAAIVAIYDYCERCMGGAQPVRDFHVHYFGLPECVAGVSLPTIRRDQLWLEARGYVTRARPRLAEFVPTNEGRAWVAAESARP